MKPRPAPGVEARRTPEFAAELRERARAWIPLWTLDDGERDFGRALLDVAARFSSEVAERLDRAGEKMQRGFLDWLAVQGRAARPARMPVVFKLADTATSAVVASAPVRMQVDAGGASVIFETETGVRLLPGRLETVVGVDTEGDAVYLPPPGLSDLEPLEPLPVQWQLKSFAAAGATTLQVDPEAGLAAGLIVEAAGQQYRLTKVDGEIVTIEPPLTGEFEAQTILRKVTAFAPFDGKTRNRQEHALYLGHAELLDVESAATLSITGARALREGVTWQYWGKVDGQEEDGWQPLKLAPEAEQQNGAVVLLKPKGSIEPREIGGRSSRWIRAITTNVPPSQQPFQSTGLAVGINAVRCDEPMPSPPGDDTPSPAAEGMANITPLVLDSLFYPLGREPRQFDAFYLGCPEAFSKPGAKVQLHFEIGNASFESLSFVRAGVQQILAGVAGDGYLYLLDIDTTGAVKKRVGTPLRPPSPEFGRVAFEAAPIPLDPRPAYRAAVWNDGTDVVIAVAAAGVVWAWRESFSTAITSGWQSFGTIEDVTDSNAPIHGLAFLDDGLRGRLFALREGKLFVRDLNNPAAFWDQVPTHEGVDPVELKTIVAVAVENDGLVRGTLLGGLVGVATDGTLYAVAPFGKCRKLLDEVDPGIAPAAVLVEDELIAVAAGGSAQDRRLVAVRANIKTPALETKSESLGEVGLIGHSFDVNVIGGEVMFALSVQDQPRSTALVLWTPLSSTFLSTPSINRIPSEIGAAGGSPTLLPLYVIEPARSGRVLVAPFGVGGLNFRVPLETAVIASAPSHELEEGDQVAIPTAAGEYALMTADEPFVEGGETLYEFDVASIDEEWFVYRKNGTTFQGSVIPGDLMKLKLAPGGTTVSPGTFLLITTDSGPALFDVVDVSNLPVVELGRELDLADPPATVPYRIPEAGSARLAPLLRLTSNNNDWPALLLDRTFLIFPGAEPEQQRGKAFLLEDGKPVLVALGEHWTKAPVDDGSGVLLIVDATLGEWKPYLGESPPTNPTLSWEYSNGTTWWKLDPLYDDTLNLKQSGTVRFTVPADLRPMDWAGRTNYWIRARLIGGDYGREIVTVTTKPTGNPGETQQTVERSTAGIRAPAVLKLHIAYRLCTSLRPAFVLAQDSGSMRDQSDANRTRGAIVEAFVPLAVTLGRLSSPAAATDQPADDCAPPCHCSDETTTVAGGPATAPAQAAAAPLATDRALFIGLNAAPSGVPVNVLLLVEQEMPHEQFAPMQIEALVADRFVPIVAEDTTRALGASGLLSMSFAVAPTPRELFGMENLTWLRLTPGGSGPASQWTPTLRGAYLNAVWASAAETLTRELLGSSEGAPGLTVRLARPPVLHDSLELRVKEPLGDEEWLALRERDETRVASDVEGLSGMWVRWDRVVDPGDEPPTARVYALDEATGEIRFGDGQHGMIPPIGRDSIVAFTYRRTEIGGSDATDVPANSVTARTALNLVSPLETVEAVFAADRAAGGAPPDNVERVVRFGAARLRHRNRAVTARDFEDLALESSPDIVQARCFTRAGQVRLVVVMRGVNPLPDAAEVRELESLLLAAAPASLSAPDALRITGPRLRRLRILLKLRVASLDHAGEVSREVQERITALFDTATGGVHGDGWALGSEPGEDDIALALLPIRRLEGLAKVQLHEVSADDAERPWSGAVRRDELVMLDEDAVRLEFETVEVIA